MSHCICWVMSFLACLNFTKPLTSLQSLRTPWPTKGLWSFTSKFLGNHCTNDWPFPRQFSSPYKSHISWLNSWKKKSRDMTLCPYPPPSRIASQLYRCFMGARLSLIPSEAWLQWSVAMALIPAKALWVSGHPLYTGCREAPLCAGYFKNLQLYQVRV